MRIKQQRVYKLHEAPVLTDSELNEALNERLSTLIPKNAAWRIGWLHPFNAGEQLFFAAGDFILLRAAIQERKVPPGELSTQVHNRVRAIERDGRELSNEEIEAIELDVTNELLARAFPTERNILLIWDNKASRISVCCASEKDAESVLGLLRMTLGSLKVTPLAAEHTLASVATAWLRHETPPDGVVLSEDVVLKADGDPGQVTIRKEDLLSDEVLQMVTHGRAVVSIRLYLNEEITATIGKDLTFKRIEYGKGLLERLDEEAFAIEDPTSALEADLIISSAALRAATDTLLLALGGEPTPASAPEEETAA